MSPWDGTDTEFSEAMRMIAEDRQRIKLLEIEVGMLKTTVKYLGVQISRWFTLEALSD